MTPILFLLIVALFLLAVMGYVNHELYQEKRVWKESAAGLKVALDRMQAFIKQEREAGRLAPGNTPQTAKYRPKSEDEELMDLAVRQYQQAQREENRGN